MSGDRRRLLRGVRVVVCVIDWNEFTIINRNNRIIKCWLITRPKQVSDSVGGARVDFGFEPSEESFDRGVFVAGLENPGSVEREEKSASAFVRAEHGDDGGAGEYGEIGPHREERVGSSQQSPAPRVRALPGNVPRHINRHPRAERSSRNQHPLGRFGGVHPPAQKESGLGNRLIAVELFM